MKLNLEEAVSYHYGAFPPKEFDVAQVLEPMLEATDALARYDQMLKGLHNSEILLAPLRGQEALASSRMEGTFSTLEEVLQLQSEEGNNFDAFRSEAVETYLYARTLSFAKDSLEDGRELTSALIREMHQMLLSFGRGANKSPGHFKTEQNYVGERTSSKISFIPVSVEHLQEGLDKLTDFFKNDDWLPLLKVALGHVEFEALHPFKDGNGRVGRILVTLMLWRLGSISAPHFYISRYFEEYKAAYIQHLSAVSETGDWEGWCRFFLHAVKAQADQNLKIAESTRQLYEEMKQLFSEKLSSKYSIHALDFVFTNPVFRNSRFTKDADIPFQTAARFSRVLLDEGFLRVVREPSGRRSGVYAFEPLLALVRI